MRGVRATNTDALFVDYLLLSSFHLRIDSSRALSWAKQFFGIPPNCQDRQFFAHHR